MRKHRDDYFTQFRGHTELKHGVLYRYVVAWIQILKRSHTSLWLVDGFAGRGKDDTGKPGSPMLLAQTAAELREENADVTLIAIEERRDHYLALKQNLADFDIEGDPKVPVAYIRQGTLAANADEAFRLIGKAPAFFFLDPFGADGLSLDLVRRVLELPRGEVFALFSHLGVSRHLAVLSAERRAERVRRRVASSLFPDLEEEHLAAELAEAEQADTSLLPTQAAAARILRDLFGSGEAVEEMLGLSPGSRGRAVVQAYIQTLRDKCQATHITSLAVFDEEQEATYFLIHAAKNDQAKYKMKEAIRSAMSRSQLPEATKVRIRWLHTAPIDRIVQQVLERFAGQTVRWTEKGDPAHTVKGFALRETDLSQDQADSLKERLRPYVTDRKPMTLTFPS
jgi:three-Cys-motif partner protein